MNLLAIVLIVISAIMHAYWSYVLKKSTNKGADPVILFWLSSVVSLIIYFIVFLFFIINSTITFYGIILAAISGFFIAIYMFFLGSSYMHGDMSQVYPLSKITPLFTLFMGIFYLNETVSVTALIGIILIVIGVYSIHLKNYELKNILSPIISLKHKASVLAVLAAIISAFYGLSSKLGVIEMNPFIFVYLSYVFLVIFYMPYLAFKGKNVISNFKKFKKSVFTIGSLDLLGYSLVVFALYLSKLSYVFALRQMSILFGVLLASYMLKEKYGKTRVIASIIIASGIILISISN